MASQMQDSRGTEAAAKVSLVQFLIEAGRVDLKTAVALELGVAKHTSRADLALVDAEIHLYEIKTKRDTLNRLHGQLASYEAAADTVTVVVATKHVNTVLSQTPDHIGILEVVDFGGETKIRPIRNAVRCPNWRVEAALDLLPAPEIRARLLGGVGPRTRADLITQAIELPKEQVRLGVTSFLRERYLPTTKGFLRALGRRQVTIQDLEKLRIWARAIRRGERESNFHCPLNDHSYGDAYLSYVGRSFGPVPEDVKLLLAR